MTAPLVSVILPCRNEARFIERCLVTLQSTTYPADRLEIIVVDGMSDDGTRPLLMRAAAHDQRVTLLDNQALTSPAALNIGIRRSVGTVIMRADAHCEYAPGYIPALVRALDEFGADNVGGVTEVEPGNDSDVARGIALALAHPVAVGNSYFRTGTSAPRWVDTVPFGCWRRETFERIGLFDESLPRNQDDEFNLRLRRSGGRILLLPTVVTKYFGRETLGQLWRMFWQYGYYKPLTAMRARGALRPRQFAPAAFVLALAITGVLAPVSVGALGLFELLAGAYVFVVIVATIPTVYRCGLGVAAGLAVAFPVMHLSYGIGFLRGLLHFVILHHVSEADAPQLSR